MKTAVIEFQRNRVKRQRSGAASLDLVKTIGELRSALRGIGKAIEAVERLAIAQANEPASRQPRPVSNKKLTSSVRRKGTVVALPHPPEVRNDHPALPESAGAQT